MKVAALLLLLAAAAYAHPQRGGNRGDEGSNVEDNGVKVFMSLVKLCKRLEEEAENTDKRSWDAVFGLYAEVCQGIKAALEDEVEDAAVAKRQGPGSGMGSGRGPRPTGDTGSGMGSGMGPRPTGDTGSGMGSGRGPRPTGDTGSGRGSGSGRGPRPTGDTGSSGMGPRPTGDAPSLSMDGGRRPKSSGSQDSGRRPQKGGRGRKGGKEERSGPSPTADVSSMSGDDSRQGSGRGSGRGPRPTGDTPASPEQQLLKICFDLAEIGKEMDDKKRGVDELVEVLKGMEQVCLAAFVEARAAADE